MWNEYGSDNVHFVFGDTSNDSWTSVNGAGWRTNFSPPLTYWLSIESQLGSNYEMFGNGYVPYNIIVGPGYQIYQTGSGFDETEARNAINSAMNNKDLYPLGMISDKLITAGSESLVDLSSLFYNNTGSQAVYSVHQISSPDACVITFDNDMMTITGGENIGQSNVVIKASAAGQEALLSFSVEVYDPTMTELVGEDFEGSWPPPGWLLKSSGAGFIRSSSDHNSGSYSACHMDNSGTQNDWLATPKILIDNASTLVFWQKGLYDTYYEFHGIGYSTDGNRFTTIVSDLKAGSDWEKIYVDLSTLIGKEVHIGFNYRGDYSDIWFIDDVQILKKTGIEDSSVPERLVLDQNYPNPFNPSTQLSFSLYKEMEVKLSVYNAKGQSVAEVFSGKLNAGAHKFNFNAQELNSGVYFCRLEYEGGAAMKKMLLLK
jgi:hypothetical protein